MRRIFFGAALAAVAAALAACAPTGTSGGSPIFTIARVDPQDAAERAATGAIVGATLGAGLGATFAINPGLGATIGTEAGGGLGAIVGAATAQPLPGYQPIAVPTAAVIPSFYDTWPPGYEQPPVAAQAPPPVR
jgi:hypothetical protein